ncbi:MAG: vanomycin resistance protein VanB [Eggerthellaceae bacterium]|nr:vanomycin resistance protein VanB [Eggerthellaceae bacterium]
MASSKTRASSRQDARRGYDNLPGQLYASPSVKRSPSAGVIGAIGSAFAFIGRGIANGAVSIWNKSKTLSAVLMIALVCVIGIGIDAALTSGKIYQGVSVGDVDLSNKTVDEARSAIDEAYANKLFSTQTFVFQNEDMLDSVVMDRSDIDMDKLTGLIESEESQDTHTIWLADAITLGAELPSAELADKAYNIGRSSGIFDRIGALITGYDIAPYASYNDILVDNMIKDIEVSTGDPLVNWGVSIADGVASVTEGHDGYEIDKDTFIAGLNNYFFLEPGEVHTYVANVPYTQVKIGSSEAQSTCDAINEAITGGSSFTYMNNTISVDTPTLGSWVNTSIVKDGETYALLPSINADMATTPLVKLLNTGSSGYDVNVSIYRDEDKDNALTVKPDKSVVIPSTESALDALDVALFDSYRKTGKFAIEGSQFDIAVSSKDYDGTFNVEDAMAYGIIEAFSSYTTNYSTKASNANRIYNIHLVADLLNDSIVDAYGGTWSFNEVAGDTTEEAGFREAGSIIEGERTDSIGGGICQVATTIYNAVYDSGLPIEERHNHSLYMAAYPDGRDAAVSYPLLDLVWKNDTESDILVTTSYTESSITANLIGVNPGYTVETEVGEWQKGEKYTTKIEVDEEMTPGTYALDTAGSDGQVIEVKRTVKDRNGVVIREKTFASVYTPVTQIVKVGPDTDTEEILAKYERKDTTSDDESGGSSKSSSDSKSSGSSKSGSSSSSNGSSGSASSSGSSNSSKSSSSSFSSSTS